MSNKRYTDVTEWGASRTLAQASQEGVGYDPLRSGEQNRVTFSGIIPAVLNKKFRVFFYARIEKMTVATGNVYAN